MNEEFKQWLIKRQKPVEDLSVIEKLEIDKWVPIKMYDIKIGDRIRFDHMPGKIFEVYTDPYPAYVPGHYKSGRADIKAQYDGDFIWGVEGKEVTE